jgi:hypothetical protein
MEKDAKVWRSSGYFYPPQTPEDEAGLKGYEELSKARLELWSPEKYPAGAAYLKSVGGFLDLAVEAAGREKWWMPMISEKDQVIPFIRPSMPLVSDLRQALCARFTLEAQAEDFEGFLRDAVAVKRLMRHLGFSPNFYDRLEAVSTESRLNESIGVVLGAGVLTEGQCRRVGAALDELGGPPGLVEAVDTFTRWQMLSAAAGIAMGKGKLIPFSVELEEGEIYAKALASINRDAVDWDGVLKQMNGIMDEMVACMRAPMRAGVADAGGDSGPAVQPVGAGGEGRVAVEAGRGIARGLFGARVPGDLCDSGAAVVRPGRSVSPASGGAG